MVEDTRPSDTNPAETLRRAAALMRERAKAATPGEWERGVYNDESAVFAPGGIWTARCGNAHLRDAVDDAEHIASWHPAVALAVADLLDGEAAHFQHNYPPRQHRDDELDTGLRRALTVARAYLGESA